MQVSAFVKRETPTTESNYLQEAQQQLQEFADKINSQLKETFDAEKIKAELNKAVDSINTALNVRTFL